ncbi:glycosyltransferase family 2 protein [Enterococcus faecium]|nr:glycosyltransferase family 2 protein [Enterococcus faecium]
MIEISIVIPFFNAEQTLLRCLNSLLEQNYQTFVVYLIDDGSDDKSNEICKLYCEKDSRFKYFYQKNNGVSSARNQGLLYAMNSDFVTFIDADDSIEPNHLQSFINKIQETNKQVDLIVSGYKQLKDDISTEFSHENCYITLEKFVNRSLEDKSIYGYVWNKFFRTEVINKYNISFNKDIHIAEDLLFVIEYATHARGICFISESHYLYYITSTSAIGSDINRNNFLSKITILEAHKKILSILENIDRNAYMTLTNKMVLKASAFYRIGIVNEIPDEIVNSLKNTAEKYHKQSNLSFVEQIKYSMNIYLPRLVEFLKKLKGVVNI